jgi:hypothetical protein
MKVRPFRNLFPRCVILEAEDSVRRLLVDCVKFHKDRYKKDPNIVNGKYMITVNDPDYCQAFGILQGLYLSKNIKGAGACNDPNSPRYWLDQLEDECWNVNYKLPH